MCLLGSWSLRKGTEWLSKEEGGSQTVLDMVVLPSTLAMVLQYISHDAFGRNALSQ